MQNRALKGEQKIWSLTMLTWGMLYYLLGYLSLTIDDPGNRVAFIWLPAGVAVSAFLISPRRSWTLLFIAFFITHLLLDLTFHHQLTVSLVLASISLVNDLAIAWCVRYFSSHHDELHKVVTWIISTIIISALAAMLGVLWLRFYNGAPLIKGIWIWWSANVSGTLFTTPALVGLIGYNEPRRGWLAYLLSVVVLVVTFLIFVRTPDNVENIALTYSLACVPLVLVTIAAVLCGNRPGSVAFILFSMVVIGASWYETGPFYIARLNTEQSIILAQSYLSGAALLIVFIRALKRMQPGAVETATREIAYSLNPDSGQIVWNPHTDYPLRTELACIRTRDELLACIPDDGQKSQLQARWQTVVARNDVTDTFRFTLQLNDQTLLNMIETRTLLVTANDATAIIGFWVESRPGLYKSAPKGKQ
ncbi:MASE1 domain-containing protein [Lelliottia nimipressuralis]|uniref:MASE1 domain-containing protein n=1 Tax=Lelliottia nimipressuralis TaxID=69220 RepID=UPI00141ABC0A|nr:MASE1 domain-containing protein [Lelliottia nimipressuralis]